MHAVLARAWDGRTRPSTGVVFTMAELEFEHFEVVLPQGKVP